MSQTGDWMTIRGHIISIKTVGQLKKIRDWLYPYRPRFADWHFWAVQCLIIGIAVIHDVIEIGGYLPSLGMLYFVPISLFFIPIVYAALNFGFAGSIATVLWTLIITIPNWVFLHQGLERWGSMLQMGILFVVAVFVGQRVDRERSARKQAEAAGAALVASETKYRGLFESSPIAILVLDENGIILDANPATDILFHKAPETLKNMALSDLVGAEIKQMLLPDSENGNQRKAPSSIFSLGENSDVYLEPMHTKIRDSNGRIVFQVILRDVTQEQHKQAEMRAYTAYVLQAQEEERQRIARELHDETIQSLSLLCRRLDSIENNNETLSPSVTRVLREVRKMAEELVKGLRDFTKALRPPILDDLGMVTSIRRLLEDTTERTGGKGQLKIVGEERRLSQDLEVAFFRIAQEALWNVEHHSKATELVVTITFAEHEATLNIRDNGIGFDVPLALKKLSSSSRLGLLGMQERAELLDGHLEFQSSLREGTMVHVSVPIPVR